MSGKKDEYVELLKNAIKNFEKNLKPDFFQSGSMLQQAFNVDFVKPLLHKSRNLHKGGTHKWLQYVKKEIGNIKGTGNGGTFESAKDELCELFDIGTSLTKIKLKKDAAIKKCEDEIIALRSKISGLKEGS